MQEYRLATLQKPRFQTAKRLNMSSDILQEGRFTDVQESCFQGAKCSNMGYEVLLVVRVPTS